MKTSKLETAMVAQFAEVKAEFRTIHGLFAKVDARFAKIDQRFEEVDHRFAQIDGRLAKVDARFATIDERFTKVDEQFAEVRSQFEAMDRRITSEGADTRRHFDVVAEQMKADIAMLAGAVVAATSSLERYIAEDRNERATVTGVLHNHEIRLTALERPGS